MPIQVLPQTLINQIAAGEVVVNMASVVKELVENALDAAARHIEVAVSADLRDVTITDDGHGMDRDDAELALQRHATSKIRRAEDLFDLRTRGFRGEALPSIASVSRMELITRPANALAGTRVVVEGGAIHRIEPHGSATGTRIAIRDLFYNTPARRKFLKSATSELNAVLHLVTRQALAAPEVAFRVVREGQALLELPPDQPLGERLRDVAGARVGDRLLDIDHATAARVHGVLAPPQTDSRGDRRGEFLFVNNRPFSSRTLSAAIEQACRGFLMVGRFPIFALFVEIEPGDVDINVHPTKEEVRFRDERAIAGACHHAVKATLEAHGFTPEMHLDDATPLASPDHTPSLPSMRPPSAFRAPGFTPSQGATPQELPGFFTRADIIARPMAQAPAHALDIVAAARAAGAMASSPPRAATKEIIHASPDERPAVGFWSQSAELEVLGQIADTFIVARFGTDLLVIDQHAAHERLRYLELRARPRDTHAQLLLVPLVLEVPPDRLGAFEALRPRLEALGFALEPFGPRAWSINAVPMDLAGLDAVRIVMDLLDEAEDAPAMDRLDDLRDRVLIRAACHSSIRGGDRLTHGEMAALLDRMRAHQLSLTCPHGRPTVLRLGREELEKRFGR